MSSDCHLNLTFADSSRLLDHPSAAILTLLVVWHRRKEPIIAIGGGVCLDVAGLSANLYRRNTPVIKVPIQLGHNGPLFTEGGTERHSE
jgi:3-dehydroquinate synthetase